MQKSELQIREKKEAITLMKIMGVCADVIERFEQNNEVMLCDSDTGKYRTLTEQETRWIELFEKQYRTTVYLVVTMNSVYGTLFSMLNVARFDFEWPQIRMSVERGMAVAYVINVENRSMSEPGMIYYQTTKDGGIIRTW